MVRARRWYIITTKLAVLFFFSLACVSAGPLHVSAQSFADEVAPLKDTFVRGKVIEVVGEHTDLLDPDQLVTQRLRVQILEGEEKGKEIEADYSMRLVHVEERKVETGDRVVINKTESPTETLYAISDVYRLRPLAILILLFFACVVALGRMRGWWAVVGLCLTMAVIFGFLIPRLVSGHAALPTTLISLVAIACVSMFLAHGWRARTVVAFVSTVVTIGVTYSIGDASVGLLRLFGSGTEEAFYLQFSPLGPVDLRGLLLSGMLLGALGVLDDITTAQAAAVEEIHLANPSFSWKELYRRGFSVGREHIASLVNTLVLAYAGTSLPLLLLFYIYEKPFWVTLNSELVMEEVVRTLVGSFSLLCAVPLTTLIAARWFARQNSSPT